MKMECFSSSVILIMAFSGAFELVARLGHHELAHPSQGDLAFGDDGLQSWEEPVIHHHPSQFVPSMGIQDSKELNSSCLYGETCILGSLLPALPLSMDGTVSMTCTKRTVDLCPITPGGPGSVPCVSAGMASFAAFLSHSYLVVMDNHLTASGTPELTLSACALMPPVICLAIQSYN
uniref:Uncharacterized protein n=1 Tax=Monodon monoceros TaxID=40151 RepID=A0A8C6B969_MONMO